MRKKSHILLATYLADHLEEAKGLQEHRKAFCFGSILPDIRLSFITTRHEFCGTFEELQRKMKALTECDLSECEESVFWRKLGEVLHYVADYFTFPHNKQYTGNFFAHNKYEKHLKNRLAEIIVSGQADSYTEREIYFKDFTQLVEYLKERHDSYVRRERNISDDIVYILSTCYQVFQGIFNLCASACTFDSSASSII